MFSCQKECFCDCVGHRPGCPAARRARHGKQKCMVCDGLRFIGTERCSACDGKGVI